MQPIKNVTSRMFNRIFNKEKYQAKPEVKETYLDDVANDQSGIDIVINDMLETEGKRSGDKLYIISDEHKIQSDQFVYHNDRIAKAGK
jgi:hypothetical protein